MTAETDELCFASATWLAEAIRTRRISSLEAVDACLARIQAVNPAINAVVRLAEDARERARDADAALARGKLAGPLHGVPFTIKDSLDTAGIVTTAGTVGWRDRVPTTRRHGRHPPQGGGGHPAGQDEHAGVHLVG